MTATKSCVGARPLDAVSPAGPVPPKPAGADLPCNVAEWDQLYDLPWAEASPQAVAPVATLARGRRRVEPRSMAEVVAEIVWRVA